MNKKMKFITVAATALLAVSPVLATVPQTAQAASSQVAKNSKGTITIARANEVITKDHNFIRYSWDNPDKDGWEIKAGVVTTIPGKTINFTGETMMFQGRQYLGVGYGGYVNSYTVARMNGNNTLMMASNAYIYNKNGKRIKNFRGQKKLLKNHIVERTVSDKEGKGKFYYTVNDTNYTVPSRTIKGKVYFNLGGGGYVKAVNVNRANAQNIYTTAPITVKMMGNDNVVRLYGKKYKDTKIKLKSDQKLIVDKLVHIKSLDTSDPALFYHIKGTKNDWVMAEAITNVNFQMGVTEER